MRLKLFGRQGDGQKARREAQIMIRHPNYSGLQRDQITQPFVGAKFINGIGREAGRQLLSRSTAGYRSVKIRCSASAIPIMVPRTSRSMRSDTDGNVFDASCRRRRRLNAS